MTILSATAPATGPATVTFRTTDSAGTTLDFLAELAAGAYGATRGPRFSIAQHTTTPATPGGTYDTNLYQTANAGDPSGTQTRPTSVPSTIDLATAAANYTDNGDGTYTFTFPTTAAQGLPALAAGFPQAPDQTRQTLVGMQAARTFDGVQYPAGASLEFIPGGGAVTPHQVVTDAACNQCHKHLTAHGTRRTVNLCLTCHTPGWIMAAGANNTKNAIDFRVLVHQIHRGQQPTDVQVPNPPGPYVYKWSASNDFSNVAFAPPNTVRNCVFCHKGGAQSDNWKNRPSRVACGACHYAIDWTTGANHLGGPQTTDANCATCHQPDTDGVAPSITKVHSFLYDALTNTTFTGRDLSVVINSINVTTPAAATVTFTVTLGGAPVDLALNPINSLRFTVAGPTTDYGGPNGPVGPSGVLNHIVGYAQSASICTGTPPTCTGGGLAPVAGTPGRYTANLPDLTTAAGQTVGVGVEAYIIETGTSTCTGIPPGTTCPATREWAMEPLPPTPQSPTGILYGRVGGGTATPRRLITDAAKCNVCHLDLGFHGGEARKGPDYCAMCHNSQNVNDERTSQFEVDGSGNPFTKTPGTVQLSVMIHKIHKGSEMVPPGTLPNPRPTFTLGATRDFRADPTANPPRAEGEAPPVAFAGSFPGDIKDCQTCHLPGGYGLPEANVLATRFVTFTCTEATGTDTNAVCGTLSATGGVVAPDTAAGDAFWSKTETGLSIPSGQAHCGSCHDSTNAVTHFSAMTVGGVESCDVCHGDNRILDPIQIHIARP
ncbi:MAG TPA: OmcA/MtrC family decaheme c-type cytochrome [Anaeromyxobacteraceae bacterium]|nr:OmcA/MtrC family decaheme c-type cytochrome [Anaeromyxobacteraceae bacterium]